MLIKLISGIIIILIIFNYGQTENVNVNNSNINTTNLNNNATTVEAVAAETIVENVNEIDKKFAPYQLNRNNEFDWKLSKLILLNGIATADDDKQNMILSTLSIKLLLTILAEAAENHTSTHLELISTILPDLHTITEIREYFVNIFNSILSQNKNNKYFTFKIGSKLYIDDDFEPKQNYTNVIKKYYQTEIEKINFHKTNETTDIINNWCSSVTDRNIQNLINPNDIDFSSVLILLNVIYFNGYWLKPFSINETISGRFYLKPTEYIHKEFMVQQSTFYYTESEDLDARIIRLPYKGEQLSMYILLPNAKGGVNELLSQLNKNNWYRIQKSMNLTNIRIELPKFKFDYSHNVNQLLEAIGITQIFSSDATLTELARKKEYPTNVTITSTSGNATGNASSMSSPATINATTSYTDKYLFVSKILQKSGIDVNEKGSTVHTLTEIELTNKFQNADITFIANYPFAFIIEDETTGTILFLGKVFKPL